MHPEIYWSNLPKWAYKYHKHDVCFFCVCVCEVQLWDNGHSVVIAFRWNWPVLEEGSGRCWSIWRNLEEGVFYCIVLWVLERLIFSSACWANSITGQSFVHICHCVCVSTRVAQIITARRRDLHTPTVLNCRTFGCVLFSNLTTMFHSIYI